MFGMGDRSRWADVGDLIIQRPSARGWDSPEDVAARKAGVRWIGIVYEVEGDTRVWIHWNGNRPPTYNVEHGYLAVNIHNLRSNFDLVKA